MKIHIKVQLDDSKFESFLKSFGKYLISWRTLLFTAILALGTAAFQTGNLSTLYHKLKNSINYSYASDDYTEGQTLYTIAMPGNLRPKPSTKTEPIEYLPLGTSLVFKGSKSEKTSTYTVNKEKITEYWLEVQSLSGQTGFIFGGAVATTSPKGTRGSPSKMAPAYGVDISDYMIVIGNRVRIRERPQVTEGEESAFWSSGEIVKMHNEYASNDIYNVCGNTEAQYWFYTSSLTKPEKEGWTYGACLRHLTPEEAALAVSTEQKIGEDKEEEEIFSSTW